MHFKKGTNRIVILFPSIRIAVKLPIINIWKAVRTAIYVMGWDEPGNLRMYWEYPASQMGGLKFWLFRGIVANRLERRGYRTNPTNPFLQPTYFSLGGLMNLERYGDPCPIDHDTLWDQLWEITNGHIQVDYHHFDNPANFCVDRGVLRMVDYGNIRTLGIALVWGEKIVREFDLAGTTAKPQSVL
ncbi:MAG: hypothetical protein P4M11_13855 [Candidatus Pacebacteria bacterium]|nr:hypothetical protein [Candidatus Paceibacterota bacterium]